MSRPAAGTLQNSDLSVTGVPLPFLFGQETGQAFDQAADRIHI